MEYFKIYTYGEYDKMANIKLKARNLIREKGEALAGSIDNFFVNH